MEDDNIAIEECVDDPKLSTSEASSELT